MSIYVDIEKRYEGFSLHVQFEAENEVLALLGASGCGKSMTLKCIAGVIKPDRGRIVVDGETLFCSEERINLPPQKRRVGLLFQNYALFPNMTVEQNIAAGLSHVHNKQKRQEKIRQLAESFYLSGLEGHYPAQLSGGQQQRTALARILASEPRLIMLDEPLSALDSFLRWQLEQELLTTLEAFQGTALYVSHNRDEVYRLADSVCVINEGRSERKAGVKALFRAPETFSSALLSGCKNYTHVEKAGSRAVRALDWGCTLPAGRAVGEEIAYLGVRAHYITPHPHPDGICIPCRVVRITEDVFSTIIVLHPLGAQAGSNLANIRMELSKEEAAKLQPGMELEAGFAMQDMLLLR